MAQPTAQAQQLLEYTNRMRQNPSAELNLLLTANDPNVNGALNFFNVDRTVLAQQWTSLSPTAPVAWSDALADAALGHNQQMIANNLQSHQLPGEPALGQRATNAGYTGWINLGENIAASSTSPFQAHASLAIDWGNGPSGIQSPPGHRNSIMSANFREAGFGLTANATGIGPLVVTEEFGNRFALSNKAWLLGVAYQDANRNQFYDIGEGLGNLTVQVNNLGSTTAAPLTTTTWDAGGYQVLLDPGQYQVQFKRNGAVLKSENVTISAQNPANVKKDLVLTTTPKHDLGGDGKSDILWRNTNGQVALWQMDGLTLNNAAAVNTVSTDWQILDSADFNGDGRADVLWRNTTDGAIAVWQMNGSTIATSGTLGFVGDDWQFAATGDLTGDGKADILWRNINGQVALWQGNGTNPAVGSLVGSAGTDWGLVGTGDFTGDGQADILWRNAISGQVALWQIVNGSLVSSALVATVGLEWQVGGIADFDGNGRDDLLWRNAGTGELGLWSMNGSTIAQNSALPGVGTDWAIADTGDLNGDGKADLLWRNGGTGQVAAWLLNGSNLLSTGLIGNADASWQVAFPGPLQVVQGGGYG